MPLPVLPACLPARRRVSARAWAASGRPCRRAGGRAAGLGFTLGGGNQSASLGSTSLTGWIKYRVLDESGTEQASGRDYLLGTGKWEYLQTGVRIAQAGTIEVMAGTSGSGEAVYFDNLRVEQSGGLIVQEQHQYAYGAPLPGLSYVVGSKRYRYGYQGQYAERDSVTGFESFELRLYNSRVGRWLSYDPEGQFDSPYVGVGNNPVSGIDPDGGFSGPIVGTARYSIQATARTGISTGLRTFLQTTSSAARAATAVSLSNARMNAHVAAQDGTSLPKRDMRRASTHPTSTFSVIGPQQPTWQNDFDRGAHAGLQYYGYIEGGMGLFQLGKLATGLLGLNKAVTVLQPTLTIEKSLQILKF